MAHECPDCGMLCHCKGDIEDMEWGPESRQSIECEHWKICDKESDEDYDDSDEDLP